MLRRGGTGQSWGTVVVVVVLWFDSGRSKQFKSSWPCWSIGHLLGVQEGLRRRKERKSVGVLPNFDDVPFYFILFLFFTELRYFVSFCSNSGKAEAQLALFSIPHV